MDYAKLLLQLFDLFVAGTLAFERYRAHVEAVRTMKAEGRDPTPDEWDALRAEGVALDDRLDAASDRLNG